MNLKTACFIISFLYVLNLPSLSQAFDFQDLNIAAKQEKVRKDGFKDSKKVDMHFDKQREKGEGAYNEEYMKWEEQRYESLLLYKKQKKKEIDPTRMDDREQNASYKAYLKDLELERKDEEIRRQAYVNAKNKALRETHPLTLEEELNLTETRPRYDYKKRVLYGARQKLGTGTPTWGSSGSGGGGSAPPFAPPPPPSGAGMPDNFGIPPSDTNNPNDFPPPPPPPESMPFDNPGGFPPPPPQNFDDGGGFAPPPPDDFGDFPPPEF